MTQSLSTYYAIPLAITFSVLSAATVAGQTPFSHAGVDGLHPGSSVLPNEQVDPASGNLTVVATDLVLPGNAGLDLRVTRVYNSAVYPDYTNGSTQIEEDSWAGIGWKLHFGRVLNNESVIEMGDGSRHALHAGLSGGWMTSDFWLYDKTTHTLKLPNGLIYQFDRDVFLNPTLGNARYVTEIRDPYNNRLTFTYVNAPGPPDGVAQIHQDLGWGQIRDVTFTYDATLNALATMSYGGRTWTYQQQPGGPAGFSHLTHVTPPIGPGWSYEYTGMVGELTKLITPSGGFVSYTYADATRRAGTLAQLSRVAVSRTTGGPDITAGTWTYSYSVGTNQDTTVVTCPCGTQTYRFNGTGLSGNFAGWLAGTLAEQTIENGSTVLERRTYAYGASEAVSNDPMPGVNGVWTNPDTRIALLAQTVVTRGPQSWTTTPLYHFGLGNYNDYGRPYQIEEAESTYQNRRTTRTFQYGFAPYIVDRIATESVRVQTSYLDVSGPFESSWVYELSTGFLLSQNLFGIVSAFDRTPDGNLSATIDALGNRTTSTFSWGVMTDVRPPSATGNPGTHITMGINSDGRVASAANDIDLPTLYSYDALGRVTWTRQNGFNGSMIEYDLVNNRFVRVGSGPSGQTEYTLDGFGRTIRSANLVNLKTRVERDACGRVTFSSAPYTAGSGTRGTSRQFDALGRVTQETDPAGAVTTYTYDGLSVTRTDASTRTTVFEYRAFGGPGSERLMSVRDATSVTTSYVYDVHGNLTKVVGPASGLTRTWARRPSGLADNDSQPESGTTSYVYDNAGNLTQTTDANGDLTTFDYYPDGTLKLRNAPGTQDDLTITYNAAGRVSTLLGATGTTTFGYFPRGLLQSRSDQIAGTTFTSSYTYDNDDLLATITYPSNRIVSYTLGTEHRLASVSQNGSVFANNFTYDDAGRLWTYQTGAVTHSFTYDLADRPKHLLATSSAGALDLTYTYDTVGNVSSIADPRPGAQQDFTIDPLDRLSSADGPWGHLEWTYDASGNRLTQSGAGTTTYTYNATTQRLSSTSGAVTENFQYDNVGRLLSDSFGTYTYTKLGLLASATRTGMAAAYAYDNAGGRVSRTVNNQTIYSIRSADGAVLSEYSSPCSGTPVWDRDLIYAGGRLLGAVRSTAASATISVVSSTLSVGESSGSLTVSFALTTPGGTALSCPVTAEYHTTNGTATSGADFTDKTGTVLFPAGSSNGATQSIVISILTDTLDENDETFFVDLASANGASVGTANRTSVTITDDDTPPTISVSDAGVNEGNGGSPALVFTVTLSTASGRSVSVNYATYLNSAIPDVDFVATSGMVAFAPGVVSQTVSVFVIPDTIDEPDESVLLNLSAPVSAALADAQARGVIYDDDPPASPTPKDFNGDGWGDLVWRHRTTGSNALWYLNAPNLITTTNFDPVVDAAWEIRGVADLNNDAKPDLIWQNQSNGDLAVWYMNNQILNWGLDLLPLSGGRGDPDLNWKVVAATDMNGDGHPDLVWSNRQTGDLRVWHMDGELQLDSVPMSQSVPDTQWQIVGVADMNADHRPDLVWRHYGAGYLVVWFMQDTQLGSSGWLSPDTVSDLNWHVAAVADMNADGQTDLVWQNISTGGILVWFMSGTVETSSYWLQGSPVTDTNWRIVGAR